MTAILITIGIVICVVSGLFLAAVLILDAIERRRWRRERARMAAYHERMAAQNGRPYSHAILERSPRR